MVSHLTQRCKPVEESSGFNLRQPLGLQAVGANRLKDEIKRKLESDASFRNSSSTRLQRWPPLGYHSLGLAAQRLRSGRA